MKFDAQFLFSAKYAHWISSALIILCLLAILSTFASLFFSPKIAVAPPPNTNTQQLATQDSINYLAKVPLFGVYIPKDANEPGIKKSLLQVKLVGILLDNSPDKSYVILRTAGGLEKNYRVGDAIPGGAMIKRIRTQGVLVEREGAIESITLPKNALTFELETKPLAEEKLQ